MKKLAVVFALVGAIVALVGIFLPWLSYESAFSISLSGWKIFHTSGWEESLLLQMGMVPYSGDDVLIVFIAAIVMLVCSLLAFFIPFKTEIGSAAVKPFGIIFSLAAAVVIAGLIWFLIDVGSAGDKWHIGYGVYVCGGGVVLGLVGGVLVSMKK